MEVYIDESNKRERNIPETLLGEKTTKILETFIENPLIGYNVEELVNVSEIDKNVVKNHIEVLEELGVIEEKEVEGSPRFVLDGENKFTNFFAKLMYRKDYLDDDEVWEIAQECLDEMYRNSTPSITWEEILDKYGGEDNKNKGEPFYEKHEINKEKYEEIEKKYRSKIPDSANSNFSYLLLDYAPKYKDNEE